MATDDQHTEKRCFVCERRDRADVEADLKVASMNAVADKFGIPRSSLQKHVRDCCKVISLAGHKGGRPCATCASPERAEIEAGLLRGETFKALERRHAISDTAIRNHALNCVPGILIEVAARRASGDGFTAGLARDRCEAILATLEAIIEKLKADTAVECEACGRAGPEARSMVAVAREARHNITLLARITGELAPQRKGDVVGSKEWKEAEAELVAALGNVPGALEAIAKFTAERRAG